MFISGPFSNFCKCNVKEEHWLMISKCWFVVSNIYTEWIPFLNALSNETTKASKIHSLHIATLFFYDKYFFISFRNRFTEDTHFIFYKYRVDWRKQAKQKRLSVERLYFIDRAEYFGGLKSLKSPLKCLS